MSNQHRVIPTLKPDEVPIFNSLKEVSIGDRKRWGLIMDGGKMNDYRIAKATGVSGSVREITWNRDKNQHDCCKSKAPWRHRVGCPKLEFES